MSGGRPAARAHGRRDGHEQAGSGPAFSDQDVRHDRCPEIHFPGAPSRRGVCGGRRKRRRQVDHDQDHDRYPPADLRNAGDRRNDHRHHRSACGARGGHCRHVSGTDGVSRPRRRREHFHQLDPRRAFAEPARIAAQGARPDRAHRHAAGGRSHRQRPDAGRTAGGGDRPGVEPGRSRAGHGRTHGIAVGARGCAVAAHRRRPRTGRGFRWSISRTGWRRFSRSPTG